jgi:hypothetical protein
MSNEARSGNPAKKAAAKKAVSDISAFKKRSQGINLPLPSGLVVKAKRVELQTFILQGAVPNPLMEIVSEALDKGKKADIAQMVGVDENNIDLGMVRDMYEMVNGIVVASILQPKVLPVPESDEDRDDDLLYVDEVDDEDKMFIFQWATGGTSDVETFRQEARADMATLAEIQGGQSETE